MIKVVDVLEASNDLHSILEATTEENSCTIVSRDGKQDVILMSIDRYNQLMETIHQKQE